MITLAEGRNESYRGDEGSVGEPDDVRMTSSSPSSASLDSESEGCCGGGAGGGVATSAPRRPVESPSFFPIGARDGALKRAPEKDKTRVHSSAVERFDVPRRNRPLARDLPRRAKRATSDASETRPSI